MKTKNELQNLDTQMESIIYNVNVLLSKNPEWKSRYKGYF